jgi:nucleoside-diphosphate-sugar epimerase
MGSPIRTLGVNILGTMNVLDAASRLRGLARFATLSTSEIFGPRRATSTRRTPSGLCRGGALELRRLQALASISRMPATVSAACQRYGFAPSKLNR